MKCNDHYQGHVVTTNCQNSRTRTIVHWHVQLTTCDHECGPNQCPGSGVTHATDGLHSFTVCAELIPWCDALAPPTCQAVGHRPSTPAWHPCMSIFVHRLMKAISVVRPGYRRMSRLASSLVTTKATSSRCPPLPRPRRARNSSEVSNFHRDRGSPPVPEN